MAKCAAKGMVKGGPAVKAGSKAAPAPKGGTPFAKPAEKKVK